MQVVSLKFDKFQAVKGHKKWIFTNFIAYIFARTEWILKKYCKIKVTILSFVRW